MRVPPNANEIEEMILGSMMLEQESVDIALTSLRPDDFYKPFHREIFKGCIDCVMDGDSVDLITVGQRVESDMAYLTSNPCTSSRIEEYCQIVKEKSIKRNLIHLCTDIQKRSYDETEDTFDIIDFAQQGIFEITNFEQSRLFELHEVIQKVAKSVSRIQESGQPLGIRTGLDIDYTLQGFQDGKLYIIGARPSMGKTALVITIMRRLAKDGVSSGILSLETSDESLGVRLISQASGIPAERIASGQMNDEEMNRFLDACGELSDYGILIDDQPALTAQQIRSKARIMVNKGCKIIFIDFLTLIKASGRSRHEEIGEITKVLKQTAKELHIPVVCLAQLSRKVEDRNNKRPLLSDLRESGSIEEDADGILFLYRPEYYGVSIDEAGNPVQGIAEVIIAKNKDGQTGVRRLLFNGELMRFDNLSRNEQAPF